jgi:methylenetetrahydrofolate--tRNA-(uracil-5-)-methyltransferase
VKPLGNWRSAVCSNSLGSKLPDRATGLLQAEMKRLNSLIIRCAEETAVPAGGALAVDREVFSRRVTELLSSHPRIEFLREEVTTLPPAPCVIASGPLTSEALAASIREELGSDYLYFFDAISPIVEADSLDRSICFRASRRDPTDQAQGDYLNCPMNKSEYETFVAALIAAEKIQLRDFEQGHFFEGCLPIEILAARSPEALAYGPMRPIGLTDPRSGKRPWAVVQLRQDNLAGSLYNLVGFQTNLKWGEQERVLRLIPGLAQAEFVRLGQMHRNTYINSPTLLHPTMELRSRAGIFFAGQIVGVEGYAGNAASGLLAGINLARYLSQEPLFTLPRETMLGALSHYVTHTEPKNFQPMKANFGLFPELVPKPKEKPQRAAAYAERALQTLKNYLHENDQAIRSNGQISTSTDCA